MAPSVTEWPLPGEVLTVILTALHKRTVVLHVHKHRGV